MSKNYYEVLGVDRNASDSDIKNAYRSLAKKYHPDINSETSSEDKFKEITEAYEVLSDPDRKRKFDMFGSDDGRHQGHGFNMNDIFSQFGDFFGNGFKKQQRKGNDMKVDVTVNLSDVMFGSDRKIKYRRHVHCTTCSGQGGTDAKDCSGCGGSGIKNIIQNTPFGSIQSSTTCNECGGNGKIIKNKCNSCKGTGLNDKEEIIDIKIPPGISNDMMFSMPGNGNYIKGGIAGDLYIHINEIPDSKFRREGNNLHYDEWINIPESVLGTEKTIETLLGTAKISISPGTVHGKVFTIHRKGTPIMSTGNNGDLLIKINISIPQVLTEEQRKLFNDLKEIM